MRDQFYIYLLANNHNTVLYVGVTNDIVRRVDEHRAGEVKGFTSKYNVHTLVYYEVSDLILDAIAREKQIKKGSRAKKIALIVKDNPTWRDLWEEISS